MASNGALEGNPTEENTLKVAALQMAVISGEPRKNMVRAEKMLQDAASQRVQAALLPELWTCGYAKDEWARIAAEHAGETLDFLRNMARKLNLAIIGGSFPEQGPDGIYSTCYVIRPDGEVISR